MHTQTRHTRAHITLEYISSQIIVIPLSLLPKCRPQVLSRSTRALATLSSAGRRDGEGASRHRSASAGGKCQAGLGRAAGRGRGHLQGAAQHWGKARLILSAEPSKLLTRALPLPFRSRPRATRSAMVSRLANPRLGPTRRILAEGAASPAGFAIILPEGKAVTDRWPGARQSHRQRLPASQCIDPRPTHRENCTLIHGLVSQEWKNKYIPLVLNRPSNTQGGGREGARSSWGQGTQSREGGGLRSHESVAYSCP